MCTQTWGQASSSTVGHQRFTALLIVLIAFYRVRDALKHISRKYSTINSMDIKDCFMIKKIALRIVLPPNTIAIYTMFGILYNSRKTHFETSHCQLSQIFSPFFCRKRKRSRPSQNWKERSSWMWWARNGGSYGENSRVKYLPQTRPRCGRK